MPSNIQLLIFTLYVMPITFVSIYYFLSKSPKRAIATLIIVIPYFIAVSISSNLIL